MTHETLRLDSQLRALTKRVEALEADRDPNPCRMFPSCEGVTHLAATNSQCLTCGRFGQRCDRTGAKP